jgi:protein TonB
MPDPLQNFVAYMGQIAVIAAAATVLLRALPIPSAGVRHFCWRLVLATCLIAPWLLRSTMPTPQPVTVVVDVPAAEASNAVAAVSPVVRPESPRFSWRRAVVIALASGLLLRLAWLGIGLLRLRHLRRTGVEVSSDDDAEMQRLIGTRASIRSVDGLAQPVTFGVLRPVVLLPASLATSPATFRRAIVTHELFHVRRRDWLWVVTEELLCAVFWFHPAIWWLTGRIQATREELVDALTVLATGSRKTYIEALLAFADAGRVHPAPALARRAHLFTRILGLSKETVMSSTRVVISGALVVFALAAAGWYASAALPVMAAAPQTAAATPAAASPASQSNSPAPSTAPSDPVAGSSAVDEPARDGSQVAFSATRDGKVQVFTVMTDGWQVARFGQGGRAVGASPDLKAEQDQKNAVTPENPIPRRLYAGPLEYPAEYAAFGYWAAINLGVVIDGSGTPTTVEVGSSALSDAAAGSPQEPDRRIVTDAFRTAAVDAVKQWRYDAPVQAPLMFWVEVRFRPGSAVSVSQSPLSRGVWATRNEAGFGVGAPPPPPPPPPPGLAGLRTEKLADATSGQLAQLEESLKVLRARLAEADAAARLEPQSDAAAQTKTVLRLQLSDLEKQMVALRQATNAPAFTWNGRAPIRVGGDVRPPTKVRDVPPVYPAMAQSAHAQGVVIIEVIIDEQGNVADARVLRSVPLLDQAALDAVRQWQFTPTQFNGAPTPVLMTVTVNFTLQ